MTQQFTPISPVQHRSAGWSLPGRYTFAAQDVVVPVVMAELSHLLANMPLAFVHKHEGAPFQLVAVQSLQVGFNAYVAPNGRWLGNYVPSFYRGYPFRLMPIEGSERMALCVDLESGCFHAEADTSPEATGEPGRDAAPMPLFDEQGGFAPELAARWELLQAFEKNRRHTRERVAELQVHGLIVPWELHLQHGDPEQAKPVRGLHRVDEAALKQLPGEALEALTRSGALSLAYAQLFSEQRLGQIGRRYQLHGEWQRHVSEAAAMETLFEEEGDIQLDFGE